MNNPLSLCLCFTASSTLIVLLQQPVWLTPSGTHRLPIKKKKKKKPVGSCSQLKSLKRSELPHMVVDAERYLSDVKVAE